MEYIADTFYQGSKEPGPQSQPPIEIEVYGKKVQMTAEYYMALVKKAVAYEESLKYLQNMIDIQEQPGNYDVDPYMYGMLIGMILAKECMVGESLPLPKTPTKWLHKANTLREQIADLCEEWYEDHVGELTPQNICIKFEGTNVEVIELIRLSDPIIGKEDIDTRPEYPPAPPSNYQGYENIDGVDFHTSTECMFNDYAGYEG